MVVLDWCDACPPQTRPALYNCDRMLEAAIGRRKITVVERLVAMGVKCDYGYITAYALQHNLPHLISADWLFTRQTVAVAVRNNHVECLERFLTCSTPAFWKAMLIYASCHGCGGAAALIRASLAGTRARELKELARLEADMVWLTSGDIGSVSHKTLAAGTAVATSCRTM
jgi:hypothetical protein